MQFSDLLADLRANKLHSCYFLFGPDSYLVEAARKALVQAFQESAEGEVLLSSMALDEVSVDELVSVAMNRPMFASKQIIVVKGIMKMRENQSKKLSAYFQDPSPFTVLILVAGDLGRDDKRKKIFEILKSGTRLVELDPLTAIQARAWIDKQFRKEGLDIDEDARELLLESQGYDLGRLHTEVEKLILYGKEEKRITFAAVGATLGASRDHSVFELLDAISAKDLKGALRLANHLLSDSSGVLSLVNLLARHVKQLLKIRELSSTMGIGEMAKAVGMSPYFLKKMMDPARRFSPQTLLRALDRLAQADDRVKRSSLDTRVFMESLIADLTR